MNGLTKYTVAAALAFGGMTATVAAAAAMPMVPVAQPAASAMVEHVAWGCGPGWHPNHWGRCVPNRVVFYPGYYYGWHGPVLHVWHQPYYGWHRWHRQ